MFFASAEGILSHHGRKSRPITFCEATTSTCLLLHFLRGFIFIHGVSPMPSYPLPLFILLLQVLSYLFGDLPLQKTTYPCLLSVCTQWYRTRADTRKWCSVQGVKGAPGFRYRRRDFQIYEELEEARPFPTREELKAADRVDLVNAILAEGGWLSVGWVEEEEGNVHRQTETGTGNEYALQSSVDGLPSYSLASYSSSVVSKGSSLRSLTEVDHNSEGIEGILSRLEKERADFYALESRERDESRLEKERTMEQTRYSWGNLTKMYGGPMRRPLEAMSTDEGALYFPSKVTNIFPGRLGEQCCTKFSFTRENNNSYLHQAWGTKTSEKDECLKTDLKGAIDRKEEWNTNGEGNYPESYQECIHSSVQKLKSELLPAIHLVRSGEDAHNWSEKYRCSLEKWNDLPEAWEFHENEIMKSYAKLRATRAKLSILEEKMALKIMEAQKVAQEKQRQTEEDQCFLRLLRTICIVWPSSGSDVLLVGSFDGWTRQRRMERTSSGVFLLNLKLYPGQYEIKFIVDGIWRVDPLRTVVRNNGHENNLLVVP